MARLRNIVHSDDSCMMIFEGNKAKPEPSTGVIKFPGGHIEVSRCSDGQYWAHLTVADGDNGDAIGEVVSSLVQYDHEGYLKHGNKIKIPDHDQVRHIALQIRRKP